MPRRPKSQIKVLREKKGLTQRELADSWGVSEVTVQNWETEASKAYTLACFVLMCKALACQPEELICTTPAYPSSSDINHIRRQIQSNVALESPPLRIAELRNKNGFTQKDLSLVLDVSVNTIQNWENGRTSGKKITKIIRLCETLECKYTDLVIDIPEDRINSIQSLRAKKPILHHHRMKRVGIVTDKSNRRKPNKGCSGSASFLPNSSSD